MRDFEKDDSELASLFRWAVLAGLLLWIAISIASSAPPPPHEYQPAAGAAAVTDPKVDADTWAEVTDNPPMGKAVCPPVSAPMTVNVHHACFQQVASTDMGRLEHPTRPGFLYTIRENGGVLSITPEPLPGGRSIVGCVVTPATPPLCTSKRPALRSTNNAPGQSRYCVGPGEENCSDPSNVTGELDIDEARQEGITEVLGASDDPEALMEQIRMSETEANLIDSAFKEEIETLEGTINSNERRINDLDARINAALNQCTGQECYLPGSEVQELIDEQAGLERYNADLRAQAARLADAQTRLGPSDGGMPETDKTPTGVVGGGNGGAGNGGVNGAPYVPGGGSTFGNTGPSGSQNPPRDEEEGGFTQFIQGFIESVFGDGGVPPLGNQTPEDPGACLPELICEDDVLYQRNTQCVDVVADECEYGCAPSGTACLTEAQNPRPTAQLSCQPLLADAGMTLAISYACSKGTSVGTGFSTGGKLVGTTTALLAAPPAGINTASFSLTCTNQNQSSTASCEVQIAKPGIVLVANPQSVEQNGVATIGWVTAGMQKCTISSPDQTDFTARNASRTSVNGVASTSPITVETDILLKCTTVGGNIRQATTTISII